MSEIILTPLDQPEVPLEASSIKPDVFAGKTIEEIKDIEILHGNTPVKLSDFFEVTGESSENPAELKIIIDGDVDRTKRIGEGMNAGEILIKGDVNMYVGAEMKGGKITVEGNAGPWAGQTMIGGELEILGDAGDYVGSSYRGDWRGMQGGTIIVHGNAGNEIGEYMNGGKIIIKGDVNIMTGIHMNNGLIIVEGDAIARVGAEMAGGTIVVKGIVNEFLPGFEYLGVEKDIEVDGQTIPGAFYKFLGDHAIKGAKGTVYVAVRSNSHIVP